MEFALILLISYGTKDYSSIELKRYRSDYDCYEAAKSISSKASSTARMYIGGATFGTQPTYVCVPVPK